jgi:hypothetical protein
VNHNAQHCLQNDQLRSNRCEMDVGRAVVASWCDFDSCIYFLSKGTVVVCSETVCGCLNRTDNYVL